MRKSNKILLSTIFMAAVAAGKAGAQQQASDTTTSRHHSSGSFFHWPHWNRSARARSGTPAGSTSPRSGGFGNSIRNASSSS